MIDDHLADSWHHWLGLVHHLLFSTVSIELPACATCPPLPLLFAILLYSTAELIHVLRCT